MFFYRRWVPAGLPALSDGDPQGILERSPDHHLHTVTAPQELCVSLVTRASGFGTMLTWLAPIQRAETPGSWTK